MMTIDDKMKIVENIAVISDSWDKMLLIMCKKLDDKKLYENTVALQTEVMFEMLTNTVLRMTKNNKVRKKLAEYYCTKKLELLDSRSDDNADR
jgi:hypothetical protein